MKFIVKAAAQKDLQDIATYIARDNSQRAISFVSELNSKIRTIAERPLSFPMRDEWRAGLRSGLHGQYHIVFEVTDDAVIAIRVLHGARNIPELI